MARRFQDILLPKECQPLTFYGRKVLQDVPEESILDKRVISGIG